MNTKVLFVLFLSFMGATVKLQAQTDAKQQEETRELQRRVINANREKRLHQQSVLVQTTKYNHRESEIYAKLNTEVIPDDFPVYKSEYSDEQYTILMNKWYSSHPNLLKPESTNEPK
jgi:hypothetical protein